jgi:hypothetical protein
MQQTTDSNYFLTATEAANSLDFSGDVRGLGAVFIIVLIEESQLIAGP